MNIDCKIIAHRGVFNNINIPENTMESFKKAIELNYPFELDVQLTLDNKLVVFHDDNMLRMTGIDKNIQDCTYDEIKNVNLLDTKCHIPLFAEVLKLNNDRLLINIEIKDTKRKKETIDMVMSELSKYNNYIIQSDIPKIVRMVKKHYQSITCGLLVHYIYSKPLYGIILKSCFILKYSKCDFVSVSKKFLKDRKYMKMIKDIPTMIWTIKSNKGVNYKNDFIYICDNLPYINEKGK